MYAACLGLFIVLLLWAAWTAGWTHGARWVQRRWNEREDPG